jgi:hypothetical protein
MKIQNSSNTTKVNDPGLRYGSSSRHLEDAQGFCIMSVHWILNYHSGADLLNKRIFRVREDGPKFYIDSNINYRVGVINGCIQSESSKKSTGWINHRWFRKVLLVN